METKQHYEAEIEFSTTNEAGDEVMYTIGVTEYYKQEPNPYADSDMDFYGYTDIEYDVIDADGKVVPPKDYYNDGEEIEELITDHYEELARNEY
jgi:hypothetical protein